MCRKLVTKTFINSHLDGCLTRPSAALKPEPLGTQSKSSRKLPNLVFSVMKIGDLRKKLRTYRLPTQGPKHVLIDRLAEFTLQYNAQCDSINPKTSKCSEFVPELVHAYVHVSVYCKVSAVVDLRM